MLFRSLQCITSIVFKSLSTYTVPTRLSVHGVPPGKEYWRVNHKSTQVTLSYRDERKDFLPKERLKADKLFLNKIQKHRPKDNVGGGKQGVISGRPPLVLNCGFSWKNEGLWFQKLVFPGFRTTVFPVLIFLLHV